MNKKGYMGTHHLRSPLRRCLKEMGCAARAQPLFRMSRHDFGRRRAEIGQERPDGEMEARRSTFEITRRRRRDAKAGSQTMHTCTMAQVTTSARKPGCRSMWSSIWRSSALILSRSHCMWLWFDACMVGWLSADTSRLASCCCISLSACTRSTSDLSSRTSCGGGVQASGFIARANRADNAASALSVLLRAISICAPP